MQNTAHCQLRIATEQKTHPVSEYCRKRVSLIKDIMVSIHQFISWDK